MNRRSFHERRYLKFLAGCYLLLSCLYIHQAFAAPSALGLYFNPDYIEGITPNTVTVTNGKISRNVPGAIFVIMDGHPGVGETWAFEFVNPEGWTFYYRNFAGYYLADKDGQPAGPSNPAVQHCISSYTPSPVVSSYNYASGCAPISDPLNIFFGHGFGCSVVVYPKVGIYQIRLNGAIIVSFELFASGTPRLLPLGLSPQLPSKAMSNSSSIQDYQVSVRDDCIRQNIPNTQVKLDPVAVPFSGGHNHDDAARPKGEFLPSGTVNTGATGVTVVQYTAPEVSGMTRVTLTCTDGPTCEPRDEFINVAVPGLVQLPFSTQYDLVGTEPFLYHLENHYGTPKLNRALTELAVKYAQAYPGSKLKYNDMSLLSGGLFDCFESPGCATQGGAPWKPPHKGHRRGTNADLSFKSFDGLPLQQKKDRMFFTKRLIELSNSLKINFEHGDHWHLAVK